MCKVFVDEALPVAFVDVALLVAEFVVAAPTLL